LDKELSDMTEELTPNTPAPDAFEAALAANADDLAAPAEVISEPVAEVIAEPIADQSASDQSTSDQSTSDLALASDEDGDIESDENDPNAEFRRTLRAAIGDWYVIHSYAGYEKKVKGNLANRIHTLEHGGVHLPD
jgi:transcription termination/antitermination protein NusG